MLGLLSTSPSGLEQLWFALITVLWLGLPAVIGITLIFGIV